MDKQFAPIAITEVGEWLTEKSDLPEDIQDNVMNIVKCHKEFDEDTGMLNFSKESIISSVVIETISFLNLV